MYTEDASQALAAVEEQQEEPIAAVALTLKFSTQQCWRRGRAVAETAPATEELMPGPVYAQEP
ncbi:hypothetical protein E4U54_000905 [Claviceps lovelessii]|nr:hypothetical protein E4U54_000905 [Claviceps lovelessii]